MPKDTSIKTSVSASSKTASKPTPVASSSSKPSKASSSKAQPPTASTDFDIDDIFAAPSTSAALQPPAATTAAKKKKKAKKPAAVKVEDKPVVEVSRVQTVVDPSIGVGKKIEPPAGGVGEMDGDMEAFRNSRGSGKSTGRKTEEGFSIYKEDQLGINDDEGGDTDLCPFDCQCYIAIKLDTGRPKKYIAKRLNVLEKALIEHSYPDFLGPFVDQVHAKNMLDKSVVYPRNGVTSGQLKGEGKYP